MTTPEEKKKERRMPKTVRRKFVTIDGKEYAKCPHPDCDYVIENRWGGEKVDEHVREVHKLVWLRKGKTAGWWSLSKFHPKPEEKEEK